MDRYTIVFAALQGRALLLAWDGEKWSLPQTESRLDNFTDSETFNSVEFGCRQAALTEGVLLVAGCGVESAGEDIWLTQRPIGDVSTWFAPSTGWRELGETAISPTAILSLAAAGGGEGHAYAIWSQPVSEPSESVASDIYYLGWDEQGLVGPFPVLTELPGLARQVHLLLDQDGRMLLVWTGGEVGELTFSWAGVQEAGSSLGWIGPEPIPGRGVAGETPSLVETSSGSIYLSYAIAFNESRGVYLAGSLEPGLGWDAPVQVFDGAAAGCERVGQVSLASVGGTSLHLAWVCSSMPGGVGPLSLYHSRSDDRGISWSPPMRIVDRSAAWSELEADGEGNLHLVWEEHIGGRINTWDTQSQDGGDVWDEPLSISVVDGTSGRSALTADGSGGLHLLQAVQEEGSSPVLRYTEWDGSSWSLRESLTLHVESIADLAELASTVDGNNSLVAFYAGPGERDQSGIWSNELHLAAIPLRQAQASVAAVEQVDLPTATPGPRPSIGEVESATATVSPEAAGLTLEAEAGHPIGGSIGVIAGIGTAVVLVAGLLLAWLRATRSGPQGPKDHE
jgi:hypothetical protein